MLNFTKIKVSLIYLILLIGIFFSSLNLKNNDIINKKVNLGLDLQGGSYILLEIDTAPLVNQKLQSKVIPIKKLLNKNKIIFQGLSKNEENDLNDHLTVMLQKGKTFSFETSFDKKNLLVEEELLVDFIIK